MEKSDHIKICDENLCRINKLKIIENEKKFGSLIWKGIYIYDIVRGQMFSDILTKDCIDKNTPKKKKHTEKSKRLINILKDIIKLYRLITSKYLFVIASRSRRINNKYVDLDAQGLIKYLGKEKVFCIETINRTSEGVHFDLFHLFSKLVRVKETNLRDLVVEFDHLYKEFHYEMDTQNIVNTIVYFYKVMTVYNIFFKIKKFTTIFYTNNGGQKSLLYAAKLNGIEIIEIQHGLITMNHPYYSYSKKYQNDKEWVILPDKILSYSNYWQQHCSYPVKFINIGKNLQFDKPKVIREYLTFISSMHHQDIIEKYIDELLVNEYNKELLLKLHPNQINDVNRICEKYKNKITVIFDEMSIIEILQNTVSVVAIVSTCIYEALQLGCSVNIIKSYNYIEMNDVFDFNEVQLISSIEDLKIYNFNSSYVFFDEYTPEKCLQ